MERMSKCIQCGNIYSSEPETKTGLCFRCEMEQKDQQIAELEQQLEETKSKLRISNSQLASCELELKNFKEDYNKQEKLLSEVLADKSRIQLDLDATKQQLETKNKNCLALYSALYETLAKENDENVASQIDYLTKQDNGKVNDLYKELQVLKHQLAEKDKEIESLKKQLEILDDNLTDMMYKCDMLTEKNIKISGETFRKNFDHISKIWNFIKENSVSNENSDEICISKNKLHKFLNQVANGRIKNDFDELLSENAKLKFKLSTQPKEIIKKIKEKMLENYPFELSSEDWGVILKEYEEE